MNHWQILSCVVPKYQSNPAPSLQSHCHEYSWGLRLLTHIPVSHPAPQNNPVVPTFSSSTCNLHQKKISHPGLHLNHPHPENEPSLSHGTNGMLCTGLPPLPRYPLASFTPHSHQGSRPDLSCCLCLYVLLPAFLSLYTCCFLQLQFKFYFFLIYQLKAL